MVDPVLLTRGKIEATAIGAAANVDMDVPCVGDDTLFIQVDMTGAAQADLSVNVYPFEADNATMSLAAMGPQFTGGPRLVGGHVYYNASFNVQGIEKVRVRITNNNAGGQTITRASWRLQ